MPVRMLPVEQVNTARMDELNTQFRLEAYARKMREGRTPTTQPQRDGTPPRVAGLMLSVAKKHGIEVERLWGGSCRRSEVTRARLDVMLQLLRQGKKKSEIARYLRIHPSSISHLLQRAGIPAIIAAIPVPDYSGEWAI